MNYLGSMGLNPANWVTSIRFQQTFLITCQVFGHKVKTNALWAWVLGIGQAYSEWVCSKAVSPQSFNKGN
jgi:hypothetical protein